MIICFDVDGTLDCGGGPISVQKLRGLVSAGYIIIVVSSSADKPSGFIEIPSNSGSREASLEEVKRRYPQEKLFLYVSDNPGDDKISKIMGFTYICPEHFR